MRQTEASEKAIGLRRRRIGNGCGAAVMGKVGERTRSEHDGRIGREKFITSEPRGSPGLVYLTITHDTYM